MRVIAGECRGFKLFPPDMPGVRPTSDKVKGAVFNMIAGSVPGARAMDLFSGAGSLGIEAISRGAAHCIFCDRDAASITLIRKNLMKTGLLERSTLLHGDFHRALKYDKMDLIFADPPYGLRLCRVVLEAVSESRVLNDDGILVLERGDGETDPGDAEGLVHEKSRKYGNTWIDIYRSGV